MISNRIYFLLLLVFCSTFTLFSCQKIVKPVEPVINPDAAPEEKKAVYENYQFKLKGNVFWTGIHIFQGTNEVVLFVWDLNAVGNIIGKISPETTPVFNHAMLNRNLSSYEMLISSGCFGWNMRKYIEGTMLSTEEQIITGVGVVSFISGIIFGNLSTDQFKRSFADYNQTLKNKLNIGNDPVSFQIWNIEPGLSYNPGTKQIWFSGNFYF